MNLPQMKSRMSEVLKRLSDLQRTESRSAEQESEIDTLITEANDLGPRIEREQKITDMAARAADYTQPASTERADLDPANQHTRNLADGPWTTEERADYRKVSPGRLFIESEEFRAYQRSRNGSSGRFDFQDELIQRYDQTPPEQRALIYNGVWSSFVLNDRLPGIESFVRRDLRVRELFPNVPIQSTGFEFVRFLTSTNAATEVAEPTTTGGATAKPESALSLEVVSGSTATVAHWIPITRQSLDDIPQIEAIINNELLVGLEERIDDELLNGNGVGANITGLLNTSGIQALDGAYFGGADVVDTGTNNQNANRIRRAMRTIRTSSSGRGVANFVVLNPADAERFDTWTNAQREYILGDPGQMPGVRTLWGLRVVESETIAASTALVGDSRGARVMNRQDGQIYMTDSHSDWFTKNLIAILAEARVGLAVIRPSVFAKVALAATV